MGNLKNYNFNKLDAFLSNSEYYDFYLAQDEYAEPCCYNTDGIISGACFVVHYDFNNPDIFEGVPYNGIYGAQYGYDNDNSIYSLVTWDGATNSGYTFNTFGLTGIDNGYITYNQTSGDTANTALTSAMTGTTTSLVSGDTRLVLSKVSGMTGTYEYPIEIITDSATTVGDYARLCGGFYQGYYKLDGYSYEVLPNRVPKGWVAEFWLRKSDIVCSGSTGTTLNDTYPDNKGFFFYMGTRAENKYWNIFDGLNTGCTSGCTSDTGCTGTVTTNCTVLKETDIAISGDSGYAIPLSPPPVIITTIENQFLIYGRANKNGTCGSCGAKTGLGNETVCSFTADSKTISKVATHATNTENPFLIYGRAGKNRRCGSCGTPTGFGNETVCSFSGVTAPLDELDRDADVIDNAIGFRIKDDGSIGYRALKLTAYCENNITITGVTVEEQYSASGMVQDGAWEQISVRFSMPEYDECELIHGKPRKGRLLFYVGCLLKFVAEEVDEFIGRRLNDYKDKQLGVPFNFSLGGGSQGLLESMTFDGQDPDDLGVAIETNYAGTFIGDISQFKFYICDLNWCELKHNCAVESPRYEGTPIIPSPVGIDYLFYGSFSGTSVDGPTASGMTSEVITSGSGFGITAPASPGYIYVLIPTSLSQPSDFRDSTTGCNNFNIPMITQGTVVIPDANNYNVTYTVYRTVNNINGELDIWLCN